ncbi:MAG: glycosyltransferase, partial [Terriglobia bacterium]
MGAVHFSIDVSLVEILKRALPLEVFVETGTFKGDGVQQMRSLFQELYTVESSAEYYERACERFKSDPAIHVFHDTSAKLLRKMMPRLASRSVLYWLDAHWCGEELGADVPQCPLLDELAAIGHLNEQSVLLIDDARLFLAPPAAPHSLEQWPSLDLVLKGLRSLSPAHEILALNDVFI